MAEHQFQVTGDSLFFAASPIAYLGGHSLLHTPTIAARRVRTCAGALHTCVQSFLFYLQGYPYQPAAQHMYFTHCTSIQSSWHERHPSSIFCPSHPRPWPSNVEGWYLPFRPRTGCIVTISYLNKAPRSYGFTCRSEAYHRVKDMERNIYLANTLPTPHK